MSQDKPVAPKYSRSEDGKTVSFVNSEDCPDYKPVEAQDPIDPLSREMWNTGKILGYRLVARYGFCTGMEGRQSITVGTYGEMERTLKNYPSYEVYALVKYDHAAPCADLQAKLAGYVEDQKEQLQIQVDQHTVIRELQAKLTEAEKDRDTLVTGIINIMNIIAEYKKGM